jgi:hypothetical protein
LAVAFPPACVPAKNPSSSVHHTFLPPPRRSSTVKPRVASLASLAIRAEFPPRSNSRLVVARLSWNSNRTLTLAFALDAAAHRTKHTRNTPASVSRCAFSSRQSLRRFTRASIRIATPRTTNEPSDGALGVDGHDVASFTSTASSSRVVIESHHRSRCARATYPPFGSSPWAPPPFASSRAPSVASLASAQHRLAVPGVFLLPLQNGREENGRTDGRTDGRTGRRAM